MLGIIVFSLWIILPYQITGLFNRDRATPPGFVHAFDQSLESEKADFTDAGPDQVVAPGSIVILDGATSQFFDDRISYTWRQVSGPSVILSDVEPAIVEFTAPWDNMGVSILIFELTAVDDDGITDADQVNIFVRDGVTNRRVYESISWVTTTDETVGVKVSSEGVIDDFKALKPSEIPSTHNRPNDLLYGMLQLTINTREKGGTVQVTFTFPQPLPQDYVWYKYSDVQGWYNFSEHAVISLDRTKCTMTLTDGGPGDDDGKANYVIVDPSGPGIPKGPFEFAPGDDWVPEGGSGGCFIRSTTSGR